MKKLGAIFLLSIFVFNTMGYLIAFKVAQTQAKEEMKANIENGILTGILSAFTFPKSDLAALNSVKAEEIQIEGAYYDIISTQESTSSITFYCLNDKMETGLLSSLTQHIDANISSKPLKNESGKKLFENIVKLFFSSEIPSTQFAEILTPSYFVTDSIYISAKPIANTPPPELA